MKTRLLRALAAAMATAASLSVCAANETVATERNPMSLKSYHVVVTGDAGFLKAFDASLQQAEGTKDLLESYILCANCKDLNNNPAPTMLEYYFFAEHVQKPRRMFEAMEMANRLAPSVTTKQTLLIEQKDIPGPAVCPVPKPWQCGPQPMCADGCDGDVNARGCQRCVP
jgi:hypothetical protein